MNQKLFDKLIKYRPSQHLPEWRIFLEICEAYLKKHNIRNPVVVELGTWNNSQKKFYEQLLGAEHIGIDSSNNRNIPDIHGNTHDPKTLEALKKKLDGRPINILFIDADHTYESVKKDFEIYFPLCSDIVALHDIETYRYKNRIRVEVWKFWDELKTKASAGTEYEDFLFLSIYQHRRKVQMGIGMIIKR